MHVAYHTRVLLVGYLFIGTSTTKQDLSISFLCSHLTFLHGVGVNFVPTMAPFDPSVLSANLSSVVPQPIPNTTSGDVEYLSAVSKNAGVGCLEENSSTELVSAPQLIVPVATFGITREPTFELDGAINWLGEAGVVGITKGPRVGTRRSVVYAKETESVPAMDKMQNFIVASICSKLECGSVEFWGTLINLLNCFCS